MRLGIHMARELLGIERWDWGKIILTMLLFYNLLLSWCLGTSLVPTESYWYMAERNSGYDLL